MPISIEYLREIIKILDHHDDGWAYPTYVTTSNHSTGMTLQQYLIQKGTFLPKLDEANDAKHSAD